MIKSFTIRCILLLLLFGCCCLLQAQTSNGENDILYWSKNSRLTFNDFKGRPKKEDTALRALSPQMLTHKLGAIITSLRVQVVIKSGKTNFIIRAAMKKSVSWIKDSGDYIELKHEQGHFDICEIYCRIMRRDIVKAKSLEESKEIYERILAEENGEQTKYDDENTYTAGGITEKWQAKIAERLHELDSYAGTTVTAMIDN